MHRYSGMKWADNHWIFNDDSENLTCVVIDTIEELMDLDTETKPESLWWTSTYKAKEALTLEC